MIRLVKLSRKWYGLEVPDIESDLHNVEQFLSEGRAVVFVQDIDDVLDIDIEPDDVEMVK